MIINLNIRTIQKARKSLKGRGDRSAWDKGVTDYALNLLDNLEEGVRAGWIAKGETNRKLMEKALLNGASDWHEYSWGGCALIYDSDIANALCPPSEVKRRKNGQLPPNSQEEWLDVQARALRQASSRLISALH